MNKIYYLGLLLLLTTLLPQQLFAQSEQFQPEKRIYLWDVTLSMKGYADSEDIYDVVVNALIDDINSLTDPNIEIVVMPFQEGVLAEWVTKATSEGKKSLIQNIKNYKNELVTYTNILTPFKYAVKNYIDLKKSNIIIIMTDGEHNDPTSPKSALINEIIKWGELTESINAYAFYTILTRKAADKEIIDVINDTKRIDIVDLQNDNTKSLRNYQLTPQAKVAYNIKDDSAQGCKITISCNNAPYPEDVMIHIEGRNEFIDINSDQLIENGQINFKVNLLKPLSEIPEQFDLELGLKLKSCPNDRVFLVKDNSKLTIINKKEKVLKIYVK